MQGQGSLERDDEVRLFDPLNVLELYMLICYRGLRLHMYTQTAIEDLGLSQSFIILMIVEVLTVYCCPVYLPGVNLHSLSVMLGSTMVEVSMLINFWQFVVVHVYLLCLLRLL